ncbi:lipid II:glycine glycyltransferase FemX [Alloscardovia criceti]|uniref:lipid II:glycine glycyltransferase FemX n=1 Tax=Alloscardovia criceti TaxID=356828 RepID=UPI0014615CEA|nr:GNAT family N-acetyltransferase [Alloscardovia criceti]
MNRIDQSRFEELTTDVTVPIEQTVQWVSFTQQSDGYEHQGFFEVSSADNAQNPLCVFSLVTVSTRGGTHAWLRHAPIWLAEPSVDEEKSFLAALKSWLKNTYSEVIWAHVDVTHAENYSEVEDAYGIVPYDSTVVIDLTSDASKDADKRAEEVLTRFKKRGRRDVRKALRESGLVFSDDTAQASQDFGPYHAIMVDTSSRDGFVPWPKEFYESMLQSLGAEHAHVYAGRIDGELVCWSLVTENQHHATRYYAASSTAVMRKHANDVMVFMECKELLQRGITQYDLMGIGSEASPTLKGLNEFKTKFSENIVTVPLMKALVVRPAKFALYKTVRGVVDMIRH